MVYQGGLNCMLGAFNAIPPDYVPNSVLGKVSAFGGAGYLLARSSGQLSPGPW
ncbi:sucrose symporter [Cutibacterium acnes JCM 18918]|nr:sucrose symporter [Cutibacterium acnes JCM 18918]